ncbi:MAG: class II fructose-bisphosphate aldolase [Erysipelotrichaceae bacterium]|nr:class II fructose-bisphosphate aldolase [Erysipelotrichaceae bacterium]
MAHRLGVPVEAELGCVGMADESFKIEWKYTQTTKTPPELVKDFVEKTNVDFLAVSIGNAHGPYAKNIIPHIDFELLETIANTTPIPLVLHGGSGTGDENLSKACKMGISKINVGTDLLKAGAEAALEGMETNANHGRLEFITNYNKAFKEKVMYYMDVFGSTGKA